MVVFMVSDVSLSRKGGKIAFLGDDQLDVTETIRTMQSRPVICLTRSSLGYAGRLGALRWFFSADQRINEVLKSLNFSEDALNKIYSSLGEGDKRKGRKQFLNYVRKGQITLERIGYSKNEEKGKPAKFYIVIGDQKKAGGCNTFSIGFSRKGTARGILKPLQSFNPQLTDHAYVIKGEGIASIKNFEAGVKATKLGGKDLKSTLKEISSLSKEDRLVLYGNIFSVLDEIHKKGLVHRDIKLENMVWSSEQSLTTDKRVMAIDLDYVAKQGETCSVADGTPLYFSPEHMQSFVVAMGRGYTADSKDDVWAAMLMICAIENEVSPNERLISQGFLDRFNAYSGIQEGRLMTIMKSRLEHLKSSTNLFHGIEAEYPMDCIVQKAAKAETRSSANELLNQINFEKGRMVDWEKRQVDSRISMKILGEIYNQPASSSSTGGHGFLKSFKRIFN